VLRWCTKIEEISPILNYIKGPPNILADNLSRLHRLVTPAQIAEGKKLAEPAEINEEEDKRFSWMKNTLVFLMKTSGNVLSVISTYLTLHFGMRIR
jgi:hypothetical protein